MNKELKRIIRKNPLNKFSIRKCPEFIKILNNLYNDRDDFFVYSPYQTQKTLIIQLIAANYVYFDYSILIILDNSDQQIDTFALRWISLREEIYKDTGILLPIPAYMGDINKTTIVDDTRVIVTERNKAQLEKAHKLWDEDSRLIIINDEFHSIFRTGSDTEYMTIYNEFIINKNVSQIGISATHYDLIYKKDGQGEDMMCSDFIYINPPPDHHGIDDVQWETTTPNNWKKEVKSEGDIYDFDPYFDKIYDPILIGNENKEDRIVIDRNTGAKIEGYPYVCLYTVASTIQKQELVFDYMLTREYPNTAIFTYNSEEMRLYIPNVSSGLILKSIERVRNKNKETVGIQLVRTIPKHNGTYFIIPRNIRVQSILYSLYEYNMSNGGISNIFIISGDMARQGQSFCSYEQLPDFSLKSTLLFNKDKIEYIKGDYKIELSHIRIIKSSNTDCTIVGQIRGRIDGRSNLLMTRTVSTTEAVMSSLIEAERRQKMDLLSSEDRDNEYLKMVENILRHKEPKSKKPIIKICKGDKESIHDLYTEEEEGGKTVERFNSEFRKIEVSNLSGSTISRIVFLAAIDAYNALLSQFEDGWVPRSRIVNYIHENKDKYRGVTHHNQIRSRLLYVFQHKSSPCESDETGVIFRKMGDISCDEPLYIRIN